MKHLQEFSRIALISLCALVILACGDKKEQPKPAKKAAPAKKAEQKEKVADKPALVDPSLKKHMSEHFEEIRDIERALVHGNLELAKKKAKWIAEHNEHEVVEGWEPHITDMRKEAAELAEASDMTTAIQHAASLAGECASCHRDLTAIIAFEWTEPPPPSKDRKLHMRRHRWAADRLWEGLVGPSDDLWVKGATMLAEEPLEGEGIVNKEDATALAERVHELGAQAAKVPDQTNRVALFAEMLQTCSKCHALVEK
jgi:mono/diheme cytochrome c family protein